MSDVSDRYEEVWFGEVTDGGEWRRDLATEVDVRVAELGPRQTRSANEVESASAPTTLEGAISRLSMIADDLAWPAQEDERDRRAVADAVRVVLARLSDLESERRGVRR